MYNLCNIHIYCLINVPIIYPATFTLILSKMSTFCLRKYNEKKKNQNSNNNKKKKNTKIYIKNIKYT